MSIGSFRNVDGSFPAHLLPDDNLSTVCEYVTQGENNADDRALVLSANVSRGWRDNPALQGAREQAADRISRRRELFYPRNLSRLFRECGWNIGRAPLEQNGGAAVMRFMDRFGHHGIVVRVEGRSGRPDRNGELTGEARIMPTAGVLVPGEYRVKKEGILLQSRCSYPGRDRYPNCPINMYYLSERENNRAFTNLLRDLDPLFRLAGPVEMESRASLPGNRFFHRLPNHGPIAGQELVFQYLRTDPQMLWQFDELADLAILQTAGVCRDWQAHPFLERERQIARPKPLLYRELQSRDEMEEFYPKELCRLSRQHFGRPISAFPYLDLQGERAEEYWYTTGITPQDMECPVMRYTTSEGHPSVAFLIEGYGDREVDIWSYLHRESDQIPREEQLVWSPQRRAVREIAGVVTAMYPCGTSDHEVGMGNTEGFSRCMNRHCQLNTGFQNPYQALFELATGRNPYFRLNLNPVRIERLEEKDD